MAVIFDVVGRWIGALIPGRKSDSAAGSGLSAGPMAKDSNESDAAQLYLVAYPPQSSSQAQSKKPTSAPAPIPKAIKVGDGAAVALGSTVSTQGVGGKSDSEIKLDEMGNRLTRGLDAESAEKFRNDLKEIAGNWSFNRPDKENKTVVDRLHERLNQSLYQGDESEPAREAVRDQALRELVYNLVHPTDIQQGDSTSCTAATVQIIMARSDPHGYAKFALGLLFDGHGITPAGNRVELDLAEAYRRDNGTILDPVIQGSLLSHGLKMPKAGKLPKAGGGRGGAGALGGDGRGGLAAIGGAGRGGTGAGGGDGRGGLAAIGGAGRGGSAGAGGDGRGGLAAIGGAGRGGTGAGGGDGRGGLAAIGGDRGRGGKGVVGGTPASVGIDDVRMLDGEQTKALFMEVFGDRARAVTVGQLDGQGVSRAGDRELETLKAALWGFKDLDNLQQLTESDDIFMLEMFQSLMNITKFMSGIPVALANLNHQQGDALHAVVAIEIGKEFVTIIDPQSKDLDANGKPVPKKMGLEEFRSRIEWAVIPEETPVAR